MGQLRVYQAQNQKCYAIRANGEDSGTKQLGLSEEKFCLELKEKLITAIVDSKNNEGSVEMETDPTLLKEKQFTSA